MSHWDEANSSLKEDRAQRKISKELSMNVKTVGIVGCGVMGSGIAQLCAQHGYDVVVSDVNDEITRKGFSLIRKALGKSVAKEKITEEEMNDILSRINSATDLSGFAACDIAIEAVAEKIDIKEQVFGELDRVCPEHALLATNTGSLSVTKIAKVTKRPDKVLGLHFFNPATAMKLLELIKTIFTSEETVDMGRRFAASLGKTVVVAPDAPGFLANRLSSPFTLNAIRLLDAGVATREDIDNAAKLATGMPMGPLERADLIGLDIVLEGAERMYQEYGDPAYAPPILLKKMVSAGWLGRKTGKGFCEY
jgi:3-hydroxybutyryl-CoA dehydrogenase